MQFMAGGMLLNVMAAMDLPRIKDQLGETLTGLGRRPPPELPYQLKHRHFCSSAKLVTDH